MRQETGAVADKQKEQQVARNTEWINKAKWSSIILKHQSDNTQNSVRIIFTFVYLQNKVVPVSGSGTHFQNALSTEIPLHLNHTGAAIGIIGKWFFLYNDLGELIHNQMKAYPFYFFPILLCIMQRTQTERNENWATRETLLGFTFWPGRVFRLTITVWNSTQKLMPVVNIILLNQRGFFLNSTSFYAVASLYCSLQWHIVLLSPHEHLS